MALCATTALAGAVSRLCVRGARGRFGGGSGRYLVLCLSCFPLPAPRVPRCVWRAVPSGCPLPSLAGTPFHAVCAFRALGPVALPVEAFKQAEDTAQLVKDALGKEHAEQQDKTPKGSVTSFEVGGHV